MSRVSSAFIAFALIAFALVACDDLPSDPPAPVAPLPPTNDLGAAPLAALPHRPLLSLEPDDEHGAGSLVSRFSPSQGLPGTRVVILTAFESHGCAARGECAVTIGGVDAPIVADDYSLEVEIPDDADTGPLCVTWRDASQCAGELIVLSAPLLYALTPTHITAESGAVELVARGDAFMPDSQIWLSWSPLPTTVRSTTEALATIDGDTLAPGDYQVFVYSPSAGRCGLQSEVLTLRVE